MPVRVVETSAPSQISGAISEQISPPFCTLLSVGQTFSGTQNVSSLQKDEAWRVNVRIQGYDLDHGYLCGTMEALNVPMADTPVVTFWEGEIVDGKNYTFFTGKWEASAEDDIRHWTKFPSFPFLVGGQLIIVNNCNESIWPGVLGGAGHQTPKDGGFHLGSGEEIVLDLPQKWSGRIWGRQGCSFDKNGKGSCDTGDCSGLLHCQGAGGAPPATIVEMTLGSSTSPLHFYDVSLVDGFNLPVSMAPVGGGIGCGVASCKVDVNICCPSALEVKKMVK
ncbi:hypothetical protein GH714_009985 [Hevea brasiliensis]|uniref:Thaumatin-like protein n=1 Tax=Hevea brasiliensis TaxID=3981 RepID=A0A6A6KKS7_HEVBR|nr:hypothetical protein GH714_009985 [Hevea brasiliensis]